MTSCENRGVCAGAMLCRRRIARRRCSDSRIVVWSLRQTAAHRRNRKRDLCQRLPPAGTATASSNGKAYCADTGDVPTTNADSAAARPVLGPTAVRSSAELLDGRCRVRRSRRGSGRTSRRCRLGAMARHGMAERATRDRARQGMVAGEMSGNAAHDGAANATLRFRTRRRRDRAETHGGNDQSTHQ